MMRTQAVLFLFASMCGCGGRNIASNRVEDPGVRIPIVVNGRTYSPDEANEAFRGRPLHFFVDNAAYDGKFAYAFESLEDERNFLESWDAAHPRESRPVKTASFSDSIFYEDINASGARLIIPERTAVPDLGYVNCVLWWCQDWSDRISSVTPSRTNRYTILYEYINYGADSTAGVLRLAFDPYKGFYNLTDLNFNDRARSISFEY